MEQTSSLFPSPTEFLFNLTEDSIPKIDIDMPIHHIDDNNNIDSIPKAEKYNTRFKNVQSQGFGDTKSGHVVNKKCALKHLFRHSLLATKSKKVKNDSHKDTFANVRYLASIKKKMAFAKNFEEITKFSCSLKDS